jgi:Protein of unknown function (DUF4007)
MNPVLKSLLAQIGALNKNKQNGKEKPHKLLLLQAVLDLIHDGRLSENEIYFDDKLIAQFKFRFAKGANSEDWEQPTLPFFHLRSSGFWEHKIIEGRELPYSTLTTSGGGTKRIFENIQYAYFQPEVFTLLLDSQARNVVQNFIQNQLEASAVASVIRTVPKLGTAFHETFKLSRTGLAQVLSASSEASRQGEKNNTQSLKSNTTLGNNQVKSSRRFAKGVGLIDDKEVPTVFGNLCTEFDQGLSRQETQWVMHYNMAAPWKSGPLYWNHLFCEVFEPDLSVTTEFLVGRIESFLNKSGVDSLAVNTYKTAAAVLVGSYTDDDALGVLKLLQATATNTYQVQDPVLPTTATFACLLADYWEHNHSGRADVLLSELTAGPLARLLLAEGRLGPLLSQVEKLGLVRVQRRVPPYQVFRLWDSPADVWQKHLYPTHP